MADFCKQCSIEIFGEDFGDLANISALNIHVICEGCGPTIVNSSGECIFHSNKTAEECLSAPHTDKEKL